MRKLLTFLLAISPFLLLVLPYLFLFNKRLGLLAKLALISVMQVGLITAPFLVYLITDDEVALTICYEMGTWVWVPLVVNLGSALLLRVKRG